MQNASQRSNVVSYLDLVKFRHESMMMLLTSAEIPLFSIDHLISELQSFVAWGIVGELLLC